MADSPQQLGAGPFALARERRRAEPEGCWMQGERPQEEGNDELPIPQATHQYVQRDAPHECDRRRVHDEDMNRRDREEIADEILP